MPAIPKGAKVFITGANGYIAATTCRILVQHGFTVIGAVRSAPKGDWLVRKLGDSFSYIVVPDIEKPDAFDKAIKTANPAAVIHMASPVTMGSGDPDAMMGPAVAGTKGILNSILQFGPNVKRVVITSSAASLMEPKDEPYTYTESDWNNCSVDLVAKEGKAAPGGHVYRASKVLAERAAWKFVEDNKGKIEFDLVTILPPMVFGPLEQEPAKDINSLNLTAAQLYENMTNPPPPAQGFFSLNLIDVRDVALAHVLALEKEEAGGERFIPSSGPFVWAELRDLAIQAGVKGIAPGTTEGYVPEPVQIVIDGSKAARVLGLQYTPKKDTVVEGIESIYKIFPKSIPSSS